MLLDILVGAAALLVIFFAALLVYFFLWLRAANRPRPSADL